MPSETVHICTDFDNTLVRNNVAALLIKHYFIRNPHHEPLHRRLWRVMHLLTPGLRRRYFGMYYECIRRIPAKEWHKMLTSVQPNKKWLEAVRHVRLKHRSKTASVTIVTRNCIDIVHEWVMQNRELLHKNKIRVEGIIANGPLRDEAITVVRQRADLKHIDYIGFGQLQTREKKNVLNKESIYIGDEDDEMLKPFVKNYIQV